MGSHVNGAGGTSLFSECCQFPVYLKLLQIELLTQIIGGHQVPPF